MIDFTTSQKSKTEVVVKVGGELDDVNRRYLFDCIADILETGIKHVVIDCTKDLFDPFEFTDLRGD